MTAAKPKAEPAKLGAETLTPEAQHRRFGEWARMSGCDESSEAQAKEAVKVFGRTRKAEA